MKKERFFPEFDSLQFALVLTCTLLSLALLFNALFSDEKKETEAWNPAEDSVPTVILDPGHGGMDSGAVSIHGDEEKHLNLAVAKKLGAFLQRAPP